MTFNPAIPQPTDLISQSQAQIQTNFSQSDTAFAVDHTAFSVLANQGQHKQVTLIAPISNPNQAGNIASVYTKTSGTGVELFYQHGTGNLGVSQLSGGGVTAAAYCTFTVTGGILSLVAGGFNVASASRAAQGVFIVSFTRSFIAPGDNYIAVITPNCTSVGGFAIKIAQEAKSASSFQFSIQTQQNVFTDPVSCDLVFFGVLA